MSWAASPLFARSRLRSKRLPICCLSPCRLFAFHRPLAHARNPRSRAEPPEKCVASEWKPEGLLTALRIPTKRLTVQKPDSRLRRDFRFACAR